MSRPPTGWSTKLITPAAVEELRERTLKDRIATDVRKLKDKFHEAICQAEARRVCLPFDITSGSQYCLEAVNQFVKELNSQGFQVVYHNNPYSSTYGMIEIRWSV